jgi:hypothetical protein
MVKNSNGRLLGLPSYVRLGWRGLTVTNALAYRGVAFITAVKCFLVQLTEASSTTIFKI